ncbi:MAG: T9SS type A sorting domain-containing protein [Bacteroidota bacterium]
MKKITLLISLVVHSIFLNGQPCTPGNYTNPGFYPDVIVNLPIAFDLVPYNATMTVVVPTQYIYSGFTMQVDSLSITNINGLPNGFTFTPNYGHWNAGTSGCILISGTFTTSQLGTYPLVIYKKTVIHGGLAIFDSIFGYNIVITCQPIVAGFTVSQTLFTLPPFAVQFNNTTINMNNYNFIWNFGDGSTLSSNNPSVFHTYSYNGLYSVSLVATNSIDFCSDTILKTDYIYCTGGISCNYTANINQVGPLTRCLGDSVLLSCNTDASFTYQWRKNGIFIIGETNSQIYVHQNGAYSVTISQNSTGCALTSSAIQVNFVSLSSPQLLALGNINPCTSDSIKLFTPLLYNTYLWSTGSNSPFIYVTQSGNYILTVTDTNNCSAFSLPYTINTSYLAPQSICIVGVDTAINKNLIVWEKPVSSVIDSFKIYKETIASNVYAPIGTQAYSLLSTFIDQNSSPNTKADRYKITAVDTCGSETPVSPFHKTNHLTINQGTGTNWNLIWDGYEGFSFPTYNIYRGTTQSNMSQIGSIQSNLTSYTDNPGAGIFYYMVELVNPNNCNPSKSLNSSLSNIVETTNVGIERNDNEKAINIYPNPVADELIIEIKGNSINTNFEILSSIGQVVYKGSMVEKAVVQTKNLAQGVYVVKLGNGKRFEFKKVVKE